jgi:4-coumarate--CoA ligase
LCSSGTTGLPKGVCNSHPELITQAYRMWNTATSKQEVIFNFSTIYWATGIYFLIISTLYGMKRVITSKSFNVDLMVEIINRFKVNVFLSPPSSIAQLLQKKPIKSLESIKIFMVGGSVVSKHICEAISPYLPNGIIAPVYGTSEGGFLVVSFESQRFGSAGKLLPNVHMKVIDETGRKLGRNQEGEVCFKAPIEFLGYFDDLENTEKTIRNGWVHTGDIGYFDSDDFLFIVDRKKDMLKFNNFQVYPSELEDLIGEVDGVVACCVVGVFEEDQGNDLIFAFVVKEPKNNEVYEQKIIDHVHRQVIDAKKLRGGVHFVESFAMTPSGKILRNTVRKLAREIHEKSNK